MLRRGLFALALILLLPLAAYADLININTADLTTLETLPGIGPSKGQAIIDYRTQNGPFAQISDIENVSGIGPSTYAQIAPYITVGSSNANATSASSTAAASGAASYVPPPSALAIELGADRTAYVNVPLTLSAAAKANGALDAAARLSWAFGDGSAGEGTSVAKTYRHPGTYVVSVQAIDGAAVARDDLIVTVKSTAVRIAAATGEGITLANDASDRLDLSGWRLFSGTGMFRFPEGTLILPGAQALFPAEITNLPVLEPVTLYYPNGIVAASFSGIAQPPAPEPGSQEVQTARPAVPVALTETAYENQSVSAPATTSELAAAGAAAATSSPPAARAGMMAALAHSPWTIGFLSIVAAAGGALMIL